ncbi:response regulator transcription factor [Labedaea rhizosphaerae]|uniref:LuxR family two component transcriptional regulator n=1 Tax=Labedaea rhizosphaerae TaxID=598644 RepID=A0A4R6S305_LABRH|nr:response regulator transcription factor [Labedaea rhizosphaerae]TDP93972.1 LuxR family two component transcriptional regulator [Labedaea rhizosphaerae]
MTDIRVLVVDDQQLVREGLVALLGLLDGVTVVGHAGDGAEAVRLAAETVPQVVLMDLRMPRMDGVAATAEIVKRHPSIGVLVLSTYADDESIGSALRAGARGYLTKDAGRAEILAAVRSCAVGQSTFDPVVSARLASALTGTRPEPPPDHLTAREAEVLGLIGGGSSNTEIAASLFISETTVKTHINNAFAKIGAKNRADAVRYALRHGLAQA